MKPPGAVELGDFEGTERFTILSELGSGASGSVYEVHDQESDTTVALKSLHRLEPGAIYRFKKEFRALSDISHANLVQFYELQSDGDRWFFTMELVRGESFLEYVRPEALPPAWDQETMDSARLDRGPTPVQQGQESAFCGPHPAASSLAPSFDEARLRHVLGQIAVGLSALHDAGKLHRDLKPSNVLVNSEGRVVLLDLGLVRDTEAPGLFETLDGEIVGTPAYMAPEQAAGERSTPASDFYAMGAMLYHALTGRPPFIGPVLKVLGDKRVHDPPPPKQLCKAVPDDLDTLCRALLDRDPEKRPGSHQVLLAVGAAQGEASQITSSSRPSAPFIGRQRHLRVLGQAFQALGQGRCVTVLVHGPSGIGKTVLIQRFLAGLRLDSDDLVVLAGRCYERESVPYKALDSLVDTLGRYLRCLPSDQAEQLIPDDILALARLFPVLNLVSSVAQAGRQVLEIQDSREFRRRAFGALRELLQRLARRQALVLYIDDLQWGDSDSGGLLGELLRAPDPPPLLLILAFRSEEAMSNPLLRSVLSSQPGKAASEVHDLAVGELSQVQAQKLALLLLSDSLPQAHDLAATIARESAGNPLFVDALVDHVKNLGASNLATGQVRDLTQAVETTLDAVIASRLGQLPDAARQLLDAIAVAGVPIAVATAQQVAEVGQDLLAALAVLRTAKLIRLRADRAERADEQVESYNDRIRFAVLRLIDHEIRQTYHQRLVCAMQASGRADPQALANHYREAGQPQQAAEYAEQAAEEANQALAFDRAARLYRFALEFPVAEEGATRSLQIKLGQALLNAGRGAEAAAAFQAAARGAKAAEALQLRRRAAEQLLFSGHIDASLRVVREVLQAIGMKLAPTPTRALLSLLWFEARLRIRGTGYRERDTTLIAAEQLIRIDICWALAIGLSIIDPIRGIVFGKRQLLLALAAGEPYRVARALAIEAGCSAIAGSKALARTQSLISQSLDLAHRVDHPHAIGLATVAAGNAAFLQGQWCRSLELCTQAEAILRERCTGVTWEIDTAVMTQTWALLWLGKYGEICRRLPAVLGDVVDRGDLFAETNLRARLTWFVHLVRDEPEQADHEADQAIRQWSQQGYHLQHYWNLIARAEIALYRGQALTGWQQLGARWSHFEHSLLLRIQLIRSEAFHLRARCGLAAAVEAGIGTLEYKKFRKRIERDLRRLEREHLFWADPLAKLVRAGLYASEGDHDRAEELLVAALAGFEAAEMTAYATVSRRCWGRLIGGPKGRELAREAEAWMTGQEIRRPDRMANILAPGNWE